MAAKSKKFLMGCGVGCGVLLLLGVSSCVGFTVWLNRPGEVLEPGRLFDPATTGYLEWTLAGDDAGTRAFVREMAERSQAGNPQPRGVPAFLQGFIARGQEQNKENMQQLLPIVLVWTMQAGESGTDDLHVLGISIERMGNRMMFMDLSLRMMSKMTPNVETQRSGDEHVHSIDTGDGAIGLFIRDHSVFVTSGLESARLALDRLRTPAEAVETEVGRAYAALPDTSIRGVVSNEAGSLAGIWDTIAGAPDGAIREDLDWAAIRMVTMTGGLSGPSSFEGLLELHCVDPEWAAAHAESFVTALRTDYRRSHLPLQSEVTVAGDRIQVVLRIEDVQAFLDEF